MLAYVRRHAARGWCLVSLLSLYILAGVPAAGADESSEASEPPPALGLTAPQGFEVSLYADDDLAHDIFSMTLDSHGRVVVAGRGYVKTLHDDDGDGRADRAVLFADRPGSGAHGMCFDGPDLLCTGDKSLLRFTDANGDGVADGEPKSWATLNHAEHGANGITRGPDGAFYVACGNDAGVTSVLASTPSSPIQRPNCGAMLRFAKDGSQSEILAHGFRNPYDLDFNSRGQLFTVDADGERDQFLPWYTPTRLFDVAIGMHHGWVLKGWQHSWNRPEALPDNVARLVEIGRGSPTGLTVYRHHTFPADYHDNVLSCCWTLGRVYRFSLKQQGSSYSSHPEVFLQTTGEVGFAPVDLAVGKEGELFVAIGGRGTRGGVFRVRYIGQKNASEVKPASADELSQVLRAPQPLAAWSRQVWLPLAKKLGAEAFQRVVLDSKRTSAERVRAIEILIDVFQGVPEGLVNRLPEDTPAEVQARICWALAFRPGISTHGYLPRMTGHKDPIIARAASEALLNMEAGSSARPSLNAEAFASRDRRVRAAQLMLAARNGGDKDLEDLNNLPLLDHLWIMAYGNKIGRKDFLRAGKCFLDANRATEQLEAARLMQLALGDMPSDEVKEIVFAGYTSKTPEPASAAEQALAEALIARFPAENASVNRELARVLAMLRVESSLLAEKLAQQWSKKTAVEEDLHYLIVLSLCGGQRNDTCTKQTAAALAELHPKMAQGEMTPSRNWPERVSEVLAKLIEQDPNLPAALIESEAFCRPTQSLFVRKLPAEFRQPAARKLLQFANHPPEGADEDDFRWTQELVQTVALLPSEESLPALRELWDDFVLRDDLALVLAKANQPEDHSRLVEALASVQSHVVEAAAHSLTKLAQDKINTVKVTEADLVAGFTALRQACLSPTSGNSLAALNNLLMAWTGESPEIVLPDPFAQKKPEAEQRAEILEAFKPWFEWFRQAHPAAATKMERLGGESGVAWAERIEEVAWDEGDIAQGKIVFEKRSCAKCHSGQNRLGPDLTGAAGRFARKDLLAAIVDPSRDVSPLYQTTQIVTGSGKIFQGLVVYESPEGTLLQTTPDTTIRIAGEEIIAMRKSRQSIMPNGLLNGASDAELADLLAYLQTLKQKSSK